MNVEEFATKWEQSIHNIINRFRKKRKLPVEDMRNEVWIALLEYQKRVGELTETTPFPTLDVKHRLCQMVLDNKVLSGIRTTHAFNEYKNRFDYSEEITSLPVDRVWHEGLYLNDWDRIDNILDIRTVCEELDESEQVIASCLMADMTLRDIMAKYGFTRYKIDKTLSKLEERLKEAV